MKRLDIKKLLRKKKYLFERYNQKIKLKTPPAEEITQKDYPEAWKRIYFKAYPRLEEIILPRPTFSSSWSLKKTLVARESCRNFINSALPLRKLSILLYYSAGLKNKKRQSSQKRFYPSGGSRYPLEVYCILLNTSLSKGVYHYYVKNHSLESLLRFNKFEFQKALTKYNQTWVKNASVIIIITAILKRTEIKYGERGYKISLLESGHIAQNFYLVSTALTLGCCALTGIVDRYFEKLLDLDTSEEFILYALAIGSRSKSA